KSITQNRTQIFRSSVGLVVERQAFESPRIKPTSTGLIKRDLRIKLLGRQDFQKYLLARLGLESKVVRLTSAAYRSAHDQRQGWKPSRLRSQRAGCQIGYGDNRLLIDNKR